MAASSTPRQPVQLLLIAASDEVAAHLLPVFAEAGKDCEFHRTGTPVDLRNALREQHSRLLGTGERDPQLVLFVQG